MKILIGLAVLFFSLESFAFSSISLQKEVTLVHNDFLTSVPLYAQTSQGNNDYCILSFSSMRSDEILVVPAGTKFEVKELIQNSCGYDWGRQCRLDLEAINSELEVRLSLTCKDKGMFAHELSLKKVSKILKDLALVE